MSTDYVAIAMPGHGQRVDREHLIARWLQRRRFTVVQVDILDGQSGSKLLHAI
ncbi:MAG: hypothetical protein ACRDQH_02955 [Pseudonocardiaceae bacterium]